MVVYHLLGQTVRFMVWVIGKVKFRVGKFCSGIVLTSYTEKLFEYRGPRNALIKLTGSSCRISN